MNTYETPQLDIISVTAAETIANEEDTSVIVSGTQLYPKT